MGGTGGRATSVGFSLISALTAAGPAMVKNLALEVAPVRVNMIAAGFVDTPLSATLLADRIDERRDELAGPFRSGGSSGRLTSRCSPSSS